MTRDDLIVFEDDIAAEFNAGKIPYPVHLSDGNEDKLIEVFQHIAETDWICGTWRSHYHCLLKGVPSDILKAAIMDGRSIALCFPEYRILCSALVGGSIPIALGIALGIERDGGDETVHCFLGDMTSYTGIAHECMTYARNHQLPVRWIIENNGLSVCSETDFVWNNFVDWPLDANVVHYGYHSKWPHAGAGERVQF